MKGFIILMASLMSMVAISIDAMIPALGKMGIDLGAVHANQPQFIISIIFIGMALGQIIFGPLSDAWGRKKVLYIGIAFYAFGSFICYLSQDMQQMLVGRFIQGLGIASPYLSCMAIIRDKYSGSEMARIMSLVMTIFIIVPCVAPTLGQGIIMVLGWREIFLFYILIIFVMTLCVFFYLEESLKPEACTQFRLKTIAHGFNIVLKNRQTMLYTICIGFVFGGFLGYLNSAQQIFHDYFKVGDLFSLYFGGLALIFGCSSFVNSFFVKKFCMRQICIFGMGSTIVASAIFLSLTFLTEIELWMFLIYAAVLFFACGLMFGNLNALAMEPMGAVAGTAASVIGFIASVMDTFIGASIGQLYNNTLIPLSAGFLICNLLALATMFCQTSKAKSDPIASDVSF